MRSFGIGRFVWAKFDLVCLGIWQCNNWVINPLAAKCVWFWYAKAVSSMKVHTKYNNYPLMQWNKSCMFNRSSYFLLLILNCSWRNHHREIWFSQWQCSFCESVFSWCSVVKCVRLHWKAMTVVVQYHHTNTYKSYAISSCSQQKRKKVEKTVKTCC